MNLYRKSPSSRLAQRIQVRALIEKLTADDLPEIPKLEPVSDEVAEVTGEADPAELRRECADEGASAFQQGMRSSDNPYEDGTPCYDAWMAGYLHQKAFGFGASDFSKE